MESFLKYNGRNGNNGCWNQHHFSVTYFLSSTRNSNLCGFVPECSREKVGLDYNWWRANKWDHTTGTGVEREKGWGQTSLNWEGLFPLLESHSCCYHIDSIFILLLQPNCVEQSYGPPSLTPLRHWEFFEVRDSIIYIFESSLDTQSFFIQASWWWMDNRMMNDKKGNKYW